MLEVRDLSRSFGGLRAVDGVSLEVARGEIVSLIGPNGAGKTTLFSMVSGFLRPDGGAVRFDGVDVTGQRPSRICLQGLVRTFQALELYDDLTVEENVLVFARYFDDWHVTMPVVSTGPTVWGAHPSWPGTGLGVGEHFIGRRADLGSPGLR